MIWHHCTYCDEDWTHERCINSPSVNRLPYSTCRHCQPLGRDVNLDKGTIGGNRFWFRDEFIAWVKEVRNADKTS